MATAQFPREAVPQGTPPQSSVESGSNSPAAITLRRHLEVLVRRRNTGHVTSGIVKSLAVGVSFCALLMLLHRLYLADVSFTVIAVILAATLFIGWRNGHMHSTGIFGAALDADKVLGMQERLSSAVAFAFPTEVTSLQREQGGAGRFAKLRAAVLPRMSVRTSIPSASTILVPSLLDDAAARVASIDPKTIYPRRFGRAAKVLTAATIALVAFALMPNMEWLRTPEQRALSGRLVRQGKELESVAKQVVAKKEEKDIEAKRLAERVKSLGQKMQRGRMTKREALVSMGQLRKDLEKAEQGQRSSNGRADLEQIQQGLAQQQMQSAIGQEIKEQVQKDDLKKAAEALEKLADRMDKGELSREEREKAANDLEKAARALRNGGNEEAAKQLEQAAKALRQKSSTPQSQGQEDKKQGQQGKDGKQQQQNGGQKSPQGQQGGQQNQPQGQNGQQSQQGQQGGQGSKDGSQGGGKSGDMQGNGQSGSDALRNAARSLGQGSGTSNGSGNLRDMLNKIREAEADTGQNSGSQSGQGKQGKNGQAGNCPGGNCDGEGGTKFAPTNPRGNVNGGAGLGPRNNATGRNAGGGVSDVKGARSKDKRRWEDVWSDRLPETQKKISRITGKMGNEGEMEQLPTRSEAQGGPVKTPYYEVYESYKKDAEDAVAKDTVPPAYKQPVKQYFDSLKPN
jgi:hypothetical protein